MIVVKSKQMLEIDRITIEELNVPGLLLMEHAATQVVMEVPSDLSTGVVLCGTGNNGGDGLAIARLLSQRGDRITVIVVGDYDHFSDDARRMYHAIEALDVEMIWFYEESESQCQSIIKSSDYIIDAIFGIGCTSVIKGRHYKLIEYANRSFAYTISVDMPSGINSDNGKIMGIHITSDLTVTFTLPKIGNVMYPGAMASKALKVVDIGIPQKVLERFTFAYETLGRDTLKYMPKRHPMSHKGNYGRLLIIAGSKGMAGAAIMAAKSAYRSGAGLVEVVINESCCDVVHMALPEAIVTTYSDNNKTLESLMEELEYAISQYSTILIGPGLSKSETAYEWLRFALRQHEVPVVIDADGLNLLSDDMSLLENVIVPIVITPHIGEMSRLTAYPTGAVVENTIEFAQSFSKANNLVVVLKSARTVVTDSDGACAINMMGNDGMATAGSGDVLAGVITGLIGQGLEPFKGACVGVALHSMAGDRAAQEKGNYGVMAMDIVEALPYVLNGYMS